MRLIKFNLIIINCIYICIFSIKSINSNAVIPKEEKQVNHKQKKSKNNQNKKKNDEIDNIRKIIDYSTSEDDDFNKVINTPSPKSNIFENTPESIQSFVLTPKSGISITETDSSPYQTPSRRRDESLPPQVIRSKINESEYFTNVESPSDNDNDYIHATVIELSPSVEEEVKESNVIEDSVKTSDEKVEEEQIIEEEKKVTVTPVVEEVFITKSQEQEEVVVEPVRETVIEPIIEPPKVVESPKEPKEIEEHNLIIVEKLKEIETPKIVEKIKEIPKEIDEDNQVPTSKPQIQDEKIYEKPTEIETPKVVVEIKEIPKIIIEPKRNEIKPIKAIREKPKLTIVTDIKSKNISTKRKIDECYKPKNVYVTSRNEDIYNLYKKKKVDIIQNGFNDSFKVLLYIYK